MIVRVTGKVIEVGAQNATVSTGALAYEILIPTSFAKKLSENLTEEQITFYTIQYMEGSSGHGNQFFRLVGFEREIEKVFFQVYTSVEGLGYRTALKSLVLPIPQIASAIESGDVNTLKKMPHVGGRTAQKMIASLKGRMQKFLLDQNTQPLTVPIESDVQQEVLQVLLQIGYNRAEAERLIARALSDPQDSLTAEDLIQKIFRQNQSQVHS